MNITKSLLLIATLYSTSLYNLVYTTSPVIIETLFSPDDRPAMRLIKEIEETNDKIWAAIYYISDQKVVDALVRAHNRNVQVRIISDAHTSFAAYAKVNQLAACGIPVFIPKLKSQKASTRAPFMRYPLMHDKFALFNKRNGQKKVWAGSFNWTIGANTMNYEDIVIIEGHDATHKKFTDRFIAMESRCIPFVPLASPLPQTLATKKWVVGLNPIIAQA